MPQIFVLRCWFDDVVHVCFVVVFVPVIIILSVQTLDALKHSSTNDANKFIFRVGASSSFRSDTRARIRHIHTHIHQNQKYSGNFASLNVPLGLRSTEKWYNKNKHAIIYIIIIILANGDCECDATVIVCDILSTLQTPKRKMPVRQRSHSSWCATKRLPANHQKNKNKKKRKIC